MLLLGLTGGIGTGKSSVSSNLRRRGYAVIDADEIARSVTKPGKKAYRKIREEFGDEFFDTGNEGHLDREKLGLLIFSDREKRKKLNAIVHPEIIKEIIWTILHKLCKFNRIIFLDIPLLYETNMDRYVQKVVVVSCNKEKQEERIQSRDGITVEEARKRIDAQLSLEDKVKRADYVIENDGEIEHLEKLVDKMLKWAELEWRKVALRISIFAFFVIFIINWFV